MRKFNIIINVILLILIVALSNIPDGQCQDKYVSYSSKYGAPQVEIDYIEGWKPWETQGSHQSYVQLQFIGTAQNGFAPGIVLTMVPLDRVDFSPITLAAAAEDLVAKRMTMPNAKLIFRDLMKVQDLSAIDITLTYEKPDQLRKSDANLVPFKERVIVFQEGDKFYTLRYVHQEELFNEFEKDFHHIISSLRIVKPLPEIH